MLSDLFEPFKSTLDRHELWRSGESVLVAASGGADSTCLLDLFARLREKEAFPLRVAHLNHGLRGLESDADERFVAEVASRLGVPFHARRLGPDDLKDAPLGLEAAARKARYRFLKRIAKETGSVRIALGHTQEDQAETFLLRLIRGSGRRGLGGMRPLSEGNLIRPLLEISREAVRSYLRGRGAPWREDSSNDDLRRARNRVRHRLLPLLKEEFNNEIIAGLARTAGVFREENDYLDFVTRDLERRLMRDEEQGLTLGIPALRVLHPALRSRLLRRFVERRSPGAPPPSFDVTEDLEELVREGRHQAALTLRGNLEARVLYSDLVLLRRGEREAREFVPLPVPGVAALPELGVCLCARQASPEEVGDPKGAAAPELALLDADALPGPLRVRRRRDGDHFRPLGATGESKLKSYLINRKVPRPVRDRIPLVVAGEKIAWVVGYQIDDRFKITPQTRRVLVLSKELR
jgi:tRNA(Ile)-lysidine synthase